MNIRLVRPEDSEAVRAIYAQYIHTPITFECTLPSQQAFAQRIAEICGDYPYLVCAEGDAVVGYAYAHRQMEREAYQWNAELSVYLDERHTSRGWGKSLYTALMGLLVLQGIKTVYAGVTIPKDVYKRQVWVWRLPRRLSPVMAASSRQRAMQNPPALLFCFPPRLPATALTKNRKRFQAG